MDIQRPSNARAKKIRRIVYATVAILLVGGVTYGLSRLRPAAPTVDRATIWPDEVKRGPMVREVRGLSVGASFRLCDCPELDERRRGQLRAHDRLGFGLRAHPGTREA